MDWEIFRSVVKYDAISNESADIGDLMKERMFPEKNVLYRSDNLQPLSIVSKSYKIVQPYEVIEFYRDLVGVADMKLETAGVLFGGRRLWALANTGKMAELKGDDAIKGYLLLTTSCDGTLATTAQFTSIRVVCNNTLSVSLGEKNSKIRVPHNRVWNGNEVKEQLGLVDESWSKFKDTIAKMADYTIGSSEAAEFLVKIYGDMNVADDIGQVIVNQSPAVADKCARVYDLFAGSGVGATLASAKGTLWGLLNAVTQTVDYHTAHKTIDARLNSAWYGEGNTVKNTAFKLAEEMVA